MKTLLAAIMIISLAACEAEAPAQETTTSLKLESLQKEYTETAQQVRAGQEHLLRLEGAIAILTQMKDDVATSSQTFKSER